MVAFSFRPWVVGIARNGRTVHVAFVPVSRLQLLARILFHPPQKREQQETFEAKEA